MDAPQSSSHRGYAQPCPPSLSNNPPAAHDDNATTPPQHTSPPHDDALRPQVNLQLPSGTLQSPYDPHNLETADCATQYYANRHAAPCAHQAAAHACTQSRP